MLREIVTRKIDATRMGITLSHTEIGDKEIYMYISDRNDGNERYE
jgi:hypothetical protein